MEILSVSLKNFKSHGDRHFTFQPGTNAICGENGAGKTSILEAIAWVLFDHTGDYTKEDLIRNGAGSAQVRVAFISSRDGRTYEVQRCTTKSYTLYDPQLNERLPYSRIKEEVIPWLRHHLGVSSGTDLSQLFSSTLGVPQGTFTVDFLLTKEKRKPVFDRILKVEEYREAYRDSAKLETYGKAKVKELEAAIARYDEALEQLESLTQKRRDQYQEITQAQADLQQLQTQLDQLQTERDQLSAQAVQMQQWEAQLAGLKPRIADQASSSDRLQRELQQAEQAVAICTGHRDAYQAFLQAETTLKDLEQQRLAEQTLQRQQRQQEKRLADRQLQLQTLMVQLDDLAAAKDTIARLEPAVQHQLQLEQAQQTINQQLQQCFSWQQAVKQQEKHLTQLRTRGAQFDQEISRLKSLKVSVDQIPVLEQQQQRYQQQLSRIAAATQFEADLRQLLTQAQGQGDRYLAEVQQAEAVLRDLQRSVPQWADALELALTTLHTGAQWQDQLMIALQGILSDLAEQTAAAKLEQQLQAIYHQLQRARQQQAELTNLDRLQTERSDLQSAIEEMQAHLNELYAQLTREPVLQQQQAQLLAELESLGDPRGQSRLLQQKLQQQPQLQAQVRDMQAALDELHPAITAIEQQLATYADLAEAVQTQQTLKAEYRAAYEEYLAYRELANTRKERYKQLQAAIAQLQTLEQEAQQAQQACDQLGQTFDPAYFQSVQAACQEAQTQKVALSARLPDMLKYLQELDQQLERLQTLQTKRAQAQAELEECRKVERFIKFARKAYKEAGPRITERYVQSISREADKLFRELLNRPNVGLQWTRDYEILVQEGAHTRRFINLSGGEQMCAALAVRLALLKVLAEIDVAFFDEPTTNMDKPRRVHLAEAIANIKTFRQLFVISHDDTFEQVTENIILVERETA